MKAQDILKAYVHDWTKYKIYLHVTDMELLDKIIPVTCKGKQYQGCYGTLELNQTPMRSTWDKKVPCDIINKDNWFIDLANKGYNISNVDKCPQFHFVHFEMGENDTLIFVYCLDMKQVEEVFDNYKQAEEWIARR